MQWLSTGHASEDLLEEEKQSFYTPGKYHRTDFCFEGHLTWNTVTGEFLGKHTATFWLVIV